MDVKLPLSILLFITGMLLIYISIKTPENRILTQNGIIITYNVSGCQNTRMEVPSTIYFKNDTLIIRHSVNYVCCAKIVPEVEIKDNIINITEINKGDVCKCMCNYIVQINISGLEKKEYEINVYGVKYKDIHPAEKILSINLTLGPMESETIDNFCGISTHGKCSSDKDCTTSGCSGQVCQSIFEKPIMTTCEWRDCYNAKFYGYECRCADGECQWTKE